MTAERIQKPLTGHVEDLDRKCCRLTNSSTELLRESNLDGLIIRSGNQKTRIKRKPNASDGSSMRFDNGRFAADGWNPKPNRAVLRSRRQQISARTERDTVDRPLFLQQVSKNNNFEPTTNSRTHFVSSVSKRSKLKFEVPNHNRAIDTA
jgi:hypothetical protein